MLQVRKMREKEIESYLVKAIKKMGGEAFKFVSPGNAGVPDRIVILPDGTIYFVELKSEDGRLRPIQIRQQERLNDLGCNVMTITGKEEVDRFLREVILNEVHTA